MELQLAKFAKRDLALARKHGRITIARTKVGNIELSYNPQHKTYTADYTIEGRSPSNSDRSAGMIKFLSRMYAVVDQAKVDETRGQILSEMSEPEHFDGMTDEEFLGELSVMLYASVGTSEDLKRQHDAFKAVMGG